MYYSTLFALGIALAIELIAHLTTRYLPPSGDSQSPPVGAYMKPASALEGERRAYRSAYFSSVSLAGEVKENAS
jgi:hypothetical protein